MLFKFRKTIRLLKIDVRTQTYGYVSCLFSEATQDYNWRIFLISPQLFKYRKRTLVTVLLSVHEQVMWTLRQRR